MPSDGILIWACVFITAGGEGEREREPGMASVFASGGVIPGSFRSGCWYNTYQLTIEDKCILDITRIAHTALGLEVRCLTGSRGCAAHEPETRDVNPTETLPKHPTLENANPWAVL